MGECQGEVAADTCRFDPLSLIETRDNELARFSYVVCIFKDYKCRTPVFMPAGARPFHADYLSM